MSDVHDNPDEKRPNVSPEDLMKRPWGHEVIQFIGAMQIAKEIEREAHEGRTMILPGFEQRMRNAHIDVIVKLDALSMALTEHATKDDDLWPFAVHVGSEGLAFYNTLVGTMMAQRGAVLQSEEHQYERAVRETYRLLDKALGK